MAKRLADPAVQRLRGPDRVEGPRLLGLAPTLVVDRGAIQRPTGLPTDGLRTLLPRL